jgi:transcriptional regulator with XRE-family HTH domain
MLDHSAGLSDTVVRVAHASEYVDAVVTRRSVEKTGSSGFCSENIRKTECDRFAETTVSGNLHGTFASVLCALRFEAELTLDQVASAIGVSKPSVWGWENGKCKPKRDKWSALAKVLGVDQQVFANAAREEAVGKAAARFLQVESAGRTGSLAAGREMIAKAYGVPPSAVRIMIEVESFVAERSELVHRG